MKNLELECFECETKVTIEVSDREYDYYLRTKQLIEGSDSYYRLFDGLGWVLQQMPFCEICKYEHSEVYRED